MLKLKNILIFIAAAVALILIYVFFIKSTGEEPGLVSTSGNPVTPLSTNTNQDSLDAKDFLSVLLSVKNIKLDASIFSDPAFSTLHDSNVVLTPDGTEGRVNPFAPIGSDPMSVPTNNTISNIDNNKQPTTSTFAPIPTKPKSTTPILPATSPSMVPLAPITN